MTNSSNPTEPTLKTELAPLLCLGIILIASIIFYTRFPERVPIHWNSVGEVNGWSSRAVGAFLTPAITVGLYLLLLGIPRLDPNRERYSEFKDTYHRIKAMIVISMTVIYLGVSLNALGYPISVRILVPVTLGGLFIMLGNYLGKVKSNWFMGVRTPWTLSNTEVWNKTNRLSGKLFMLGGALLISLAFLPLVFITPIIIIIIISNVAGPITYSWWLYRKLGLPKPTLKN